MIHKTGKQLPVKVSTVRLWVRTSRRRVHLIPTNYPVLRIRDWVDCIFRHGGHFFWGGNTLDDNAKAFRGELDRFWRNYRKIDPTFPFFRDNSESCYEHCIPIALHGDEGRGRAKQPILVMSVQPLLPLNDGKTNMQGYLERMVIFPYSVMFFNIESKPKLIILYPSNMHPTKANFLHPAALHSAAFSILDEELPPSSVGPDQGFGIAGQRWICGSLWAYKIYTLYVLF